MYNLIFIQQGYSLFIKINYVFVFHFERMLRLMGIGYQLQETSAIRPNIPNLTEALIIS